MAVLYCCISVTVCQISSVKLLRGLLLRCTRCTHKSLYTVVVVQYAYKSGRMLKYLITVKSSNQHTNKHLQLTLPQMNTNVLLVVVAFINQNICVFLLILT